MSDDEVMVSDEEGEETPKRPVARADEGPSEAELAMQKRRAKQSASTSGLGEEAEELLEANRREREKMEAEIAELRERSIQRKKEREQEEREMAERRAEEEARRKADEEERKKKKSEEEEKKRAARDAKMAEFEKWKNPSTPNFVIERKDRPAAASEEGGEHEEKKSKEQLEAEKQAILKQRIQPLDIDGADSAKLAEKARELHAQLSRLESEKYDLERRFKNQLGDMLELAERARNMNKVGKQGTLKRIQLGDDETDVIQEKFAGCPAKIVMYSQFERQKDKRAYDERKTIYKGPVYGFAAEKIKPERRVTWNPDTGLPEYEELSGGAPAVAAEEE